jgi:hypothetical protein
MQQTWVSVFDFLLAPVYFGVALMLAIYTRNTRIREKPYYRFYVPALCCKMIGGVALCLVYTYYYTMGGDSVNYFLSGATYVNVLMDMNLDLFWEMLQFRSQNLHLVGYNEYGPIIFSHTDYYALTTVVLSIPSCMLGLNCYLPSTIVLDYFSFLCIWKLYEVFIDHFPNLSRQFAYAVLFVPSVFFWGSGMLKDTYTLSALALTTYAVYKFLIKKERKMRYFVALLAAPLAILLIKPYIFFALLPGTLIWTFFNRLTNIRNSFLRTAILPIMLVAASGLIVFTLQYLGEYLGEYSLDNVLDKAVKTQQDLVRDVQYGNNYYNIGAFDASIAGISSKIPAALNMALFKPYVWAANNPVMFLSGLENLFVLGFSIYILIRVKFTTLIRSLFGHPLLIFSVLFALFFAFSVGLTTANYGALVRLKIPCIPFYLASLFMLFDLNKASFKRIR